MTSSRQVALFLALVLGVAGACIFWPKKSAKHTPTLPEPVSSPADEARSTRAARKPTVSDRVLPAPAASAAAADPTDDALAAAMHALEDSAPERALELARRGQALWPAGPRVAEFAATEVKCLYRLGRPSEGRGAAEAMVNKYPSSPWALEVERQTGAHPYLDH